MKTCGSVKNVFWFRTCSTEDPSVMCYQNHQNQHGRKRKPGKQSLSDLVRQDQFRRYAPMFTKAASLLLLEFGQLAGLCQNLMQFSVVRNSFVVLCYLFKLHSGKYEQKYLSVTPEVHNMITNTYKIHKLKKI